MDDTDISKVSTPKKEPYDKKSSLKYFIGYNDDEVNRTLCTKLPQMTGYVKNFDSNKTTSFQASDNKLLRKYTKIQVRINNLMNIKLDR